MRVLAFLGLSIGGLLIVVAALGSFVVQVNGPVTDEPTEDGRIIVQLEDIEPRRLRRLFTGMAALQNGILRTTPADLPDFLPQAPEGWTGADYATAEGERITGEADITTALASTTTNSILKRFEKADDRRAMGEAVVYDSPTGPIVLSIQGDIDGIQAAERGAADLVRESGDRFAMQDGVAFLRQSKFVTDLMTNTRTPALYDHFTAGIGGMVEIEIISAASAEEVQSLIALMDLAAMKATLPAV